MKSHQYFERGSPNYVFYHGLYQISRGRNPSATLMEFYSRSKNPRKDFALAKYLVTGSDGETSNLFLLGRPYLRSEIDWEKQYGFHLSGPMSHISFSPKSGKDDCKCSLCFYRDAPKHLNPTGDCQIGNGGDLAKKFFGIPSNQFLPVTVGDKELGYYCPYWLNNATD